MPTNPIQSKAYANIYITLSTINKKYFQVEYQIFYDYNPNDDTYNAVDTIKVSLPIENINATLIQNTDGNGNEQNCSLIIKNNDSTVISFSSSDWYVDVDSQFTYSNLTSIYDLIYAGSFA